MPAAITDRFEVALTGCGENEKGTADAVPLMLQNEGWTAVGDFNPALCPK